MTPYSQRSRGHDGGWQGTEGGMRVKSDTTKGGVVMGCEGFSQS